MVHPCIPDWGEGGVDLHACHSTSSTKTLCKKRQIDPDDIDQTTGATQICRECYPGAKLELVDDRLVDIPI